MLCTLVAVWLGVVNGLGYLLARHDKRRAGRGRRVPQRRFLQLALGGGAPGMALAFAVHRHKVRKRRFMVRFWSAGLVGAAAAGAAVAWC